MEVMFNDEPVSVRLVRKNNKNVYFRVSENLELIVTCNYHVLETDVLNLIEKNYKPLLNMYLKTKEKIWQNNYFYYLGNIYTVVINPEIKGVDIQDDFIFVSDASTLDKFMKKEQIRIFTDRVNVWKNIISFVPEFSLKIRRMKTRWGVCNKTKKIVTLNSELLKKDISLIDYVIIHELCHFKEPNHSRAFWDLVKEYFPLYKAARKKLREE